MSLSLSKRKVHFIGIGGIGMSGLAELVLTLGHGVSGSDVSDSEIVQRLVSLGAQIQIGHGSEICRRFTPDVVVYSTAVQANNPELVYAREKGIPIIRRAEMLAEIMRLKRGVAVAGSHGKTTTTGLLSLIIREAGMDPTIVIGGRFDAIGSNASWGGGQWLIAEADESDGSFLRLSPEIAVVTNIDREHLDHYKNFEAAVQAFADFLDRLPFYGRAILCSDCAHLRGIGQQLQKPRTWYGFERQFQPDAWVRVLSEGAQSQFEVLSKTEGYEKIFLKVKLSVPGRHNMLNATAAALAALELGVSREKIEETLVKFKGVRRRFELRGEWHGHPIVEDYAHHPTEIRATLQAARSAFGKMPLLVAFQPHRFTRTRDQWAEFATCFENADHLCTLPIYAASEPREAWTQDYDSQNFARNVKSLKADFALDAAALAQWIQGKISDLPPGSPLLVLGAGDIYKVIPLLLGG